MAQEFSLKMTEMISTHLGFSNALSLVSLREIEVTYPMKNWISCSLNLLGPGSDVTPLPTTPAIYDTIYPTDEGRTSSSSHGLSEALSLVPLRERDVSYPTKTKIRCADLSGTQQWRHSPLYTAPHDTGVLLKSSEMSSTHQELSNALSLVCIRALDVQNFAILAVLVALPPHRYNCSIEQAAVCPTK